MRNLHDFANHSNYTSTTTMIVPNTSYSRQSPLYLVRAHALRAQVEKPVLLHLSPLPLRLAPPPLAPVTALAIATSPVVPHPVALGPVVPRPVASLATAPTHARDSVRMEHNAQYVIGTDTNERAGPDDVQKSISLKTSSSSEKSRGVKHPWRLPGRRASDLRLPCAIRTLKRS